MCYWVRMKTLVVGFIFLISSYSNDAEAGFCKSFLGNSGDAVRDNITHAQQLIRETLEEHFEEIVDSVVDEPLTELQLSHIRRVVFQGFDEVDMKEELDSISELPFYTRRFVAVYTYSSTLPVRWSKRARYRAARKLFSRFWRQHKHFIPRDLSIQNPT